MFQMMHSNNHNNLSVTGGLMDMLLGAESEVRGV